MALKLKFKESAFNEEWLKEETVGEMDKIETPEGETIEEILSKCYTSAKRFYRRSDFLANADKEEYADYFADLTKEQKDAKAKETNSFNPLFIGPTGSGKTSRIYSWARDRGIEVVTINLKGDALDFLGIKSIDKEHEVALDDEGNKRKASRVKTIPTQTFDQFLTGNMKILFLDEINTAPRKILQSLYDVISFHTIQNGDEVMKLPKLLFVVGAMNPSEYGGRDKLDPALEARMNLVYVSYDTDAWVQHELNKYSADVELCKSEYRYGKEHNYSEDDLADIEADYQEACMKVDLVNQIKKNAKKLKWTDGSTIADKEEGTGIMVPRTLEAAMDGCNGTLADFLKVAKKKCGNDAVTSLQSVLGGYSDKVHKANEIWGKDYSPKQSPKSSKPAASGEEGILNQVSDKEKKENELDDNLLGRMKSNRRNR